MKRPHKDKFSWSGCFPYDIYSAGGFFQKNVSYKLSKKIFFDILGFFDEIFLIKVLVFQNFDQKVPKIEQETEVCYKKV